MVLQVKNLRPARSRTYFSLRKGEILAYRLRCRAHGGMQADCGADKRNSGEIFVDGELTNIQTRRRPWKWHCYLSEDRKRLVCVGLRTIIRR